MSELFDVAELVKIGIEDERTGVIFYAALAEKMVNPEIKHLFLQLSHQEQYHQKRFEEMLGHLGGLKPTEEYPGQYMAYLRTLTSDRAFPDEETALRAARACTGDAQALEMASRYERDTLMLMNEMRSLVPPKDAPLVDELAREEQAHMVILAEAKQKLR